MIKNILFLCAGMVFLIPAALAQPDTVSFKADNAYAFATAPMQKTGAVFMTLSNNGNQALTVTEARTEIAESVELHTMSMTGNVMEMRKVDGFTVEPGTEKALTPAGDHVMLIGLKQPLEEGGTLDLILTLDNGAELPVSAAVRKPGTTP